MGRPVFMTLPTLPTKAGKLSTELMNICAKNALFHRRNFLKFSIL